MIRTRDGKKKKNKQTNKNKKELFNVEIFHYLSTAIKITVVILQIPTVFHMSGIVKFTFPKSCDAVRFSFNVDRNTVVMQVAKPFAIVQIVDGFCFYVVVLQSSISIKIVIREIELPVSR